MLKFPRHGLSFLIFLRLISSKTLLIFEMRSNNDKEVDLVKDNVGFNLLLAIVIQNVTKAHVSPEETTFYLETSNASSSDEVTTQSANTGNTLLDDMRALAGICES